LGLNGRASLEAMKITVPLLGHTAGTSEREMVAIFHTSEGWAISGRFFALSGNGQHQVSGAN
jgi:hypothetical protein